MSFEVVPLELSELLARQVTPLANGEIINLQPSEARPHQFADTCADGFHHPVNLMIASFIDRHLDDIPTLHLPRKKDVARLGHSIANIHTRHEQIELLAGHGRTDFHAIASWHARARVPESLAQLTIVRQDQRATRVVVKTSDGENSLVDPADEIQHGLPTFGVLARCDRLARLMKQEIHSTGSADPAPVDLDLIPMRVDLRTELADDRSVDSHVPIADQYLCTPS